MVLGFKVSWRTEKWGPLFPLEKRRSGGSAIYCLASSMKYVYPFRTHRFYMGYYLVSAMTL